jgi:hypothetical protein
MDPLGVASEEDVNNPLPSPPYRAYPSSSNIVLETFQGQDSPAYRSRVDLMADYHHQNDKRDERRNVVGIGRPGDNDDVKAAQAKPTVHYHGDVHQVPAPGYPKLDSRASSIMGTDDEHDDEGEDDYDWSAEEDLEEQSVEYEKHIGVKPKPQGWGFKRYLLKIFMIKLLISCLVF